MINVITKIVGWMMIIFSSLILFGALGLLLDGEFDAGIAGMSAIMAGMLWFGVKMARKKPAPQKSTDNLGQEKTSEQLVLEAARALRGRVTPNEIAARSSLSPKEARATLRALADDDFCQITVGASGMTVYFFPEFEDVAAKKDILDESRDDDFSDFDAALAETNTAEENFELDFDFDSEHSSERGEKHLIGARSPRARNTQKMER